MMFTLLKDDDCSHYVREIFTCNFVFVFEEDSGRKYLRDYQDIMFSKCFVLKFFSIHTKIQSQHFHIYLA